MYLQVICWTQTRSIGSEGSKPPSSGIPLQKSFRLVSEMS
jgi:hypothetical protein